MNKMNKVILGTILLGIFVFFGMVAYKSYEESKVEQAYKVLCEHIKSEVEANPENIIEYCEEYNNGDPYKAYDEIIRDRMNSYSHLESIEEEIEKKENEITLDDWINLHDKLCDVINRAKSEVTIEQKIVNARAREKDTAELLANTINSEMVKKGRNIYSRMLEMKLKPEDNTGFGTLYNKWIYTKTEASEPYEDLGKLYKEKIDNRKAEYEKVLAKQREEYLKQEQKRRELQARRNYYRSIDPYYDRQLMREEMEELKARLAEAEADRDDAEYELQRLKNSY